MTLERYYAPLVLLSLSVVLAASSFVSGDEPASRRKLEWIRVSDDKTHFVLNESGKKIVLWGFNYDHDDSGRLLEDYWAEEWKTVEEDFREMHELRGNVVRIHLQLARFMESADQPNAANLQRLAKLVNLAEETGLYLDITGLGCYHKQDVPSWYDALEEDARWKVQERFWNAVANVCRESPAILCYDLMNEPVLAGEKKEKDWLAAPLGDKHFVQRINLELAGRKREEVAQQWIERLVAAIRKEDERHLITVGVIPWAYVFKGAKPLFHDSKVGAKLDFVCIHLYPQKDDVEGALAAMSVYEVGKPLVIEEIFPLKCGIEEAGRFIDRSQKHADGWISFYWGKTIEQSEKETDFRNALIAQWLRYFQENSPFRSDERK